ncbi:hypothetical protein AYO22_06112 [Fonsecaea multimorphosa]|nr:hypothetical protein AYO22_06112 [Fonsecaea multimorphosa]
MFPRFEIAGFAITLTIVFLIGARFKPSFPDLDASAAVLGFGGDDVDDGNGLARGSIGGSSNSRFDDVEEPNPFEDVRVADVFNDVATDRQDDELGNNMDDAMNSTLGFAKVFVISMPERSDKRDAFSLQARLSNISFEVRDGVAGADVSVKALPHEMVRDNIQSAMVFEDDADWDLAIKYQMMQAAQATRFVTAQPEEEKPLSPYGDYWDIIWFGHCAADTDKTNDRRFVVMDDPTVLPPWSRSEFVHPDMSIWEEDSDDYLNFQTRIYFRSSWNSCTAAYAISLRGAEKVVFTESMVPFNDPVDNGMGAMCKEQTLDFTCIAPFPTVVGVSKPAGASNRGSDIRGLDDESIIEQGRSEKIMYSTRQNIPRILTGEDEFVSVFPEDQVPPLTVKEIGRGRGHREWVWKGYRYFEEDEYLEARAASEEEEKDEDDKEEEQDHESEADEWRSPIEEETEESQRVSEKETTSNSEEEDREEEEEELAESKDKHKEEESDEDEAPLKAKGPLHRYRGSKAKHQ